MSSDAMISEDRHEIALNYARRGWRVFPIAPGQKTPLTKHGHLDATTDETAIKSWWSRWPDANIGLATGRESGIVVLDVDPRHGGDESLRELQNENGPLPETAMASTGGGGTHYFFEYPNDTEVRCSAGVVGPGLDVKADGGYVVAPPSLHPNGQTYKWDDAHHLDAIPLAKIPAWLLTCMQGEPTEVPGGPFVVPEKILDGQRNDMLYRMARSLKAKGLSLKAIGAAVREENSAKCKPPLPSDEVENLINHAWTQADRPEFAGARGGGADPLIHDPYSNSRPSINAGIQDLSVVTDKAWDALCHANDPPRLFLFGGLPIRIDEDGAPVVKELTPDRLRHEIARDANWFVRKNSEPPRNAKPPMDVVRDMLALPNPPLPKLTRIVEVPVFACDGSLLTTRGYRPRAHTYFAPASGFVVPSIPVQPTPGDIQRAKDLILEELLHDFPFVSESDRAHAVAAFLLPYARDLIDGPTPNHLIEAPSAGSGKGLLAEVLLFPAVGRHIGVVVEARDDDEWRKRLTACFREGRTVILLDNVTRPLISGVLAAALTAQTWGDRLLGKNETVSLPVRCVWLTTANNPVLSTELVRRCVRIRIDPKRDRPWQREGFRHPDLRSWVAEHRADLVWAALTLIQAWISKGRPRPHLKPLGSFEAWSIVIGGILETAGVPGFLMNLDELYDTADQEGAAWREFVALWWETFQERDVSTKELLDLAEKKEVEGLPLGRSESDQGQRVAFGKALAKQRDRVIGDFRITSGSKKQRAARWSLVRLTPPSEPVGDAGAVPEDDWSDFV